jgi:hypothetical protein
VGRTGHHMHATAVLPTCIALTLPGSELQALDVGVEEAASINIIRAAVDLRNVHASAPSSAIKRIWVPREVHARWRTCRRTVTCPLAPSPRSALACSWDRSCPGTPAMPKVRRDLVYAGRLWWQPRRPPSVSPFRVIQPKTESKGAKRNGSTGAHQVEALAQYWVNSGNAGCAGHDAQAGAAQSVATSSTVRLQATARDVLVSVRARC